MRWECPSRQWMGFPFGVGIVFVKDTNLLKFHGDESLHTYFLKNRHCSIALFHNYLLGSMPLLISNIPVFYNTYYNNTFPFDSNVSSEIFFSFLINLKTNLYIGLNPILSRRGMPLLVSDLPVY